MPFIRLTAQEMMTFARLGDKHRAVGIVFDALQRKRGTYSGEIVCRIPFKTLRKIRTTLRTNPHVFGPFQERIEAAAAKEEER